MAEGGNGHATRTRASGTRAGRNPSTRTLDNGRRNDSSDDVDPITVVIVDDHRSFGEALQIALDKERDLSVVEVITDGGEAVRMATESDPDVVLMDLQMPGVDGIEATKRIREQGAHSAVIILSGDPDQTALARAIQAGARGFVRKTIPIIDLADTIRQAHRGEPLHGSTEVNRALKDLRSRTRTDSELAKRVLRLTPRELEILQAMAEGSSPERIASDLGMSRHTLRTHTQNILTKLGLHSKVEAIVAAIRFGKVRPPGVVPVSTEDEATEGDDDGSGSDGSAGADGDVKLVR
jgi:DNA-binding NarL/FixJ family response regulator